MSSLTEAVSPSTAVGEAPAATRIRVRSWARVVYGATAAQALVFSAAAVVRHVSFNSGRFDLGNMVQAVWSTADGRFLEATAQSGDQFVRLGVHVEPLLALFAPLWLVWESPLVLVIVQAVAIALGALPVFWLARKHLGSERIAARFAFAYLLFPAVQWNAHFDFHAVSLAIPLLLYAIWYLDEDRIVAFIPFAILAAASKEHIPLLVGWLGIWYAVRKGRRLMGALVAAAGLAWFVIGTGLVQPHYAPPGVDQFGERYANVGGSPLGMLETLVTDPVTILSEATTRADLGYALVLLAPLCFLWVFEPLLALAAAPELALSVLSSKPEQLGIAHQYSSGIIPFVFAAAAIGAAKLDRARLERWSRVMVVIVAATMILTPLWFLRFYIGDLRSPAHQARVEAVALVPDGAPVSATNQLGAHLSARPRVFSFPKRAEAQWVVVDEADPTIGDVPDEDLFPKLVLQLRQDRRFVRVFESHGISVFHRRARCQRLQRAHSLDPLAYSL